MKHLQVALDDGEQVVEVVGDAAGQLAHGFQALHVLQRFFAVGALQPRGQQAGDRLDKLQLVGREGARLAAAQRQHAHHLAAVDQRHRQGTAQAVVVAKRRHREAALRRKVGYADGRGAVGRMAFSRARFVAHPHAEGLAGQQIGAAHHAEFAFARLQQPQRGRIGLHHLGHHRRQALKHHLQGRFVHGQARHLRQALAVAGPPQRLLHTRVVVDAAHGGYHVGQAVVLQGAERDFDADLAAVTPARHQFHLRAHGPGLRTLPVRLPVSRVARANRRRHQGVHTQPNQFVFTVTQQVRGLRVGQQNHPLPVHQQQRIRTGHEQRAVNFQRRGSGAVRGPVHHHAQPWATLATSW